MRVLRGIWLASLSLIAFAAVAPATLCAETGSPEAAAPPPPAATQSELAAPQPSAPAAAAEAEATAPPAAQPPVCTRTDGLGVSRTAEIDTSTGPQFGEQYPGDTLLGDHEIVLTFDDGPMRRYTQPILDVLDAECTKATFFSVGRMAIADASMLREVAARGHTIALHTWSHRNLPASGTAGAEREIELGLSAVSQAVGAPVAPFFRFPYLAYNKTLLTYLAGRGIATFGIDIDSKDFRTRNPGKVLDNVLAVLDRQKKGIILFHDIQPSTAGALASLLSEIKARGFKVVHLVAKTPATTLPAYDAIAEKMLKAKQVVAAAEPMAQRAVTWPVTAPEAAPASASAESQPAAASGATATRPSVRARRVRHGGAKTDWSNLSNDPWQLKSYGIAGGP